jgi:KTSC domain
MNRVFVESSVLASVLYMRELRLLEVEFNSGKLYRYFDVPKQSYNELLTAESKGRYFNANIRNCFSSKQIDNTDRSAV